MPLLTPASWGARNRPARYLFEFNPCHDPKDGEFAAKGSGNCKGGAGTTTGPTSYKGGETPRRPTPIRTDNIDHAVRLILQGHVVEVTEVKKVNTILTKLADMALEAKKLGKDAPQYDLCQVSVPGTNLFCNSIVRTEEHPNGILRDGMPQFGGQAVPGSLADSWPKNDKGEVDGTAHFLDHLRSMGIKVVGGIDAPGAMLKASQAELDGPHSAGMMTSKTYDPGKEPIVVSRDHYVVDGHHRWAAVVGRDAEDGRLGDHTMHITRVDAPISELLKIANAWTDQVGIKRKVVRRRKAS